MLFVDHCNLTQFQCSRGNSCISADEECDGFVNCNDISDEAKCCKLYLQYCQTTDRCECSKLMGHCTVSYQQNDIEQPHLSMGQELYYVAR